MMMKNACGTGLWTLEGQVRGVVVDSISSRRTLVPLDYSLCRRVGHDCDHVNHRETDMHAEKEMQVSLR
jgi:hypothetical protein